MRGFFLFIVFVVGLTFTINGQNRRTDSLKQLLKMQTADSNRVKLLLDVADTYYFSKPDTCLSFAEEALDLARKLRFTPGEIKALNIAGEALRFLGDYPRALKMQLAALQINQRMKDPLREAISLSFIGITYVDFREYRLGLQYLLPGRELNRQMSNKIGETFGLSNIGHAYNMLEMHDSALYFQRLALNNYRDHGLKHGPLQSLILTRYGNAFSSLGVKDSVLIYFHKALQNANANNDRINNPKIQREIAEYYESAEVYDSSLYYARQSFMNAQREPDLRITWNK